MTLYMGYAIYAVVCFAAQLTICFLTRKPCHKVRNRILRATPFGFAFFLSAVLYVLGATFGSTRANALMGWLMFVALHVIVISLVAIAAAWMIYGLVRIFIR